MTFLERLEQTLYPTQGIQTIQASTENIATRLSETRVALWLTVIPKIEALYLLLDEVTATAELKDEHILQDKVAAKQLYNALHEIFVLVRHDAYLCYTLFGIGKIEDEDLAALYYRFGKASVKPMLYTLIRFEKECESLLKLMTTTEQMALDYIVQRVDDELLKEYIQSCKKGQNVLLGLFDLNTHLQEKYADVQSLREWFSDIHYFTLYNTETRDKFDLLFEKILYYAKPVTAPTKRLLHVMNESNT